MLKNARTFDRVELRVEVGGVVAQNKRATKSENDVQVVHMNEAALLHPSRACALTMRAKVI